MLSQKFRIIKTEIWTSFSQICEFLNSSSEFPFVNLLIYQDINFYFVHFSVVHNILNIEFPNLR